MRPGVFAELQGHIDAAQRAGVRLCPLHIGDTCLAPPEAVPAHLREPRAEWFAYGATSGLGALREAVAERLRTHRGIAHATAEQVMIGAGATHALHCVSRALFDEGDQIIACAPYWPLAPGIFHSVGAETVQVNTHAPGFVLRDALQQALTPRTRAVYFVSPGNPDGVVYTEDDHRVIDEFAQEHDLMVIADEVYADLVFDGASAPSFVSRATAAARTVVLQSFSKSHALAGLRVGAALMPAPLVQAALRFSTHTAFNVPLASQEAARAALQHGDTWVQNARAEYQGTRDAVAAAMAGARFPVAIPQGGTYFFLDFAPILGERPLGDLLSRLVRDAGVILTPGPAFGDAFATHARLCFTSVPRDTVLAAVSSMMNVLDSFAVQARG